VHRIYISEERNMFVAENFIHSLVDKYGKHTVYTDGGTWYPHACTFLHLKYRLHSPLEKSMIERLIKYFKDRTESIEDYYSCNNKQNCGLQHVYNWIKMIIYLYNTKIKKSILVKNWRRNSLKLTGVFTIRNPISKFSLYKIKILIKYHLDL
jgi:transposase-like protein